MKAIDTLRFNDDYTKAWLTSLVDEKYARKLVNDHLKQNTRYRGGWTCWIDERNDTEYVFTLSNPFRLIVIQ